MVERYKNIVFKTTMYLALLISIYILIYSVFSPYSNQKYEFKKIVIIIGTLFLLYIIKILYEYVNNCNENKLNLLIRICFIVIVILQIVFGFSLKAIPGVDFSHIYAEAVAMLDNGTITNVSYFGKYPNNIPITIMVYWLFKISSLVGISDFRGVGIVFNISMIDISILYSYFIIYKLKNKKKATIFLILCTLNPLIYLYAPYIYTDTLSMPFLIGILYYFISLQNEERKHMQCIYKLLIGIFIIVGVKIRATVAIIAIALFIYKLIKSKNFYWIKSTLIILIGIILASFCYSSIEKKYVTFDYSDTAFPITHWIMMGQQGDGAFNQSDHDLTRSMGTKEEKIKANLEVLETRLENLGINGYVELVGKKIQRTWSDGGYGFESCLAVVEKYTGIYDYVVGSKNIAFIYYCQIFHVTMIFLMIFQMIRNIRNKILDEYYIINLTILGVMLFYIIWEAQPRYSMSFTLLMVMIMLQGQEVIDRLNILINDQFKVLLCTRKVYKEYTLKNIKRFTQKIGYALILMTGVMIIINQSEYTKKPIENIKFAVNQQKSQGANIKEIDKNTVITQTFKTNRSFNTIELNMDTNGRKNTASYIVELQDDEENVIYKKSIDSKDVKDDKYRKFSFDSVKPLKMTEYKIKFYSKDAIKGNALALPRYSVEHYDILPTGKLYINQQEVLGDLNFKVYDYQKVPYTTSGKYILVCIIIMIIQFWLVRRIDK